MLERLARTCHRRCRLVVIAWVGLLIALGPGKPGPVEAWAPMMLLASLFGLSRDDEVFLLSRITLAQTASRS